MLKNKLIEMLGGYTQEHVDLMQKQIDSFNNIQDKIVIAIKDLDPRNITIMSGNNCQGQYIRSDYVLLCGNFNVITIDSKEIDISPVAACNQITQG